MTGNLWRIEAKTDGIMGFTRDLGKGIEKKLGEKGYDSLDLNVNYYHLDKDTGYVISWNYKDKHFSELTITEDKEENALIIDQFHGITPCQRFGIIKSSSPEELRNAAQIYQEVASLLETKFGKPVSEHDGRTIYRARLDEKVFA